METPASRLHQFRRIGQSHGYKMTDSEGTKVRPVVIFDGHCGFCRIWIDYWQTRTGCAGGFEASEEAALASVRMGLPVGEVVGGARAVFGLLSYSHGAMWPLYLYRTLPGFAGASDLAYRFMAGHRSL